MNLQGKENLKLQMAITAVAICLFLLKIIAWHYTRSIAILTDALESTVNVIVGFLGIYSLYVSAQPKDADHPYGHGKIEFISSAVEGVLIGLAGLLIIYEAVMNLFSGHELFSLGTGLWLIAASALINAITGTIAIKKGRATRSLALVASGKHLLTDTYSTMGIIAGLLAVYFTGYTWIDSCCAIFFALIIIYTAASIIRKSIAGIMDEADEELLKEIIHSCHTHRQEKWIDMHNLRIIRYGSLLHLDCHLTLPWYLNVQEAHSEVEALENLIREKFGNSAELFVHTDPCIPSSCYICPLSTCDKRKNPYIQRLQWNPINVRQNKKHGFDDLPD